MNDIEEAGYALARTLPTMDYDTTVEKVRDLLAEEGFGVITEVDVKETLKKKLDLDFQRYIVIASGKWLSLPDEGLLRDSRKVTP